MPPGGLQVEAQGVADLVRQPQPRFELIKQHYPQVGGWRMGLCTC